MGTDLPHQDIGPGPSYQSQRKVAEHCLFCLNKPIIQQHIATTCDHAAQERAQFDSPCGHGTAVPISYYDVSSYRDDGVMLLMVP